MANLNVPPFAPFPEPAWRQHLTSQEWDSLVETWIALSYALLKLPDEKFAAAVTNDESIVAFLLGFARETAEAGTLGLGSHSMQLTKVVFQLTTRILTSSPPVELLAFSYLADIAKIFSKKLSSALLSQLFLKHTAAIEFSLSSLKKLLIPDLDAGIKGDLILVESQLTRLNSLLHISPDACTLFLAGSDFLDGLITCYRVMNPPLRKVIVTTTYLCLIGLTESEPPKWSMLSDGLFALKSAADQHKEGPLNANDSLVPELVTSTPLLRLILRKAGASGAASDSLRKRITALEGYRKGPMVRPKRLVRRKIDKGKGKETEEDVEAEMHIHRMSQITQVQDLFPDLGAGFIAKCLQEFGEDVEQVVAHLLGETLPPHLASADRTEPLSSHAVKQMQQDLAPHSTPPQLPARRNVFDDDDFDRLAMDTSKISFGKDTGRTADDLLKDKSAAPNKAAILSALAAFDSDDDERDDTYDVVDVGGNVDATNNEADGVSDGNEETLFLAYQTDAKVFDRTGDARRSASRVRLREETGMTDEAIEGWAVMLGRNPQQKRRLEAKYAFSGQQAQLERTSWRAPAAGSGAEASDSDGGAFRGGRGGRGRGRGRARGGGDGGRGGGRGGGNVAGPTGEKDTEAARKNKEAHKGSRANHNRRDARAKKMARGGFAG